MKLDVSASNPPRGIAELLRGITSLVATTTILCVLTLGTARPTDPAALRPAVVALVSFNPVLGDLPGNVRRIQALVDQALSAGANIVVLPEQATTGFGVTREQAASGLAIAFPFHELAGLAAAARKAEAVIVLGVVERAADTASFFNTAVIVMPDGTIETQRKRLASAEGFGWNARGDDPIKVFPTQWGRVAVLICADTFLMDWARIATLRGAELLIVPSNWWGDDHQIELWRDRAREDGVWVLAANRWGVERNAFPPPVSFYMSDGPSAVIDPSGAPLVATEADASSPPRDAITYHSLPAPERGAAGRRSSFTVANRRPSAYAALANPYYVAPSYVQRPGLPPPGRLAVVIPAYVPGQDRAANLLAAAAALDNMGAPRDGLIVLPALGLDPGPLDRAADPDWSRSDYWREVSGLVTRSGAQALVTSVLERSPSTGRANLAIVVVTPSSITLQPQIHATGTLVGSGEEPRLIRLRQAAVAVMTGTDSLFPELGTEVAKSGADVAVVVSELGGSGDGAVAAAGISGDLPHGLTIDDLVRHWQVMANGCMHVVASGASGHAFAANQAAYCTQGTTSVAASTSMSVTLDAATQRAKALNAYYGFDLDVLLGPGARPTPTPR